MAFVKLAVISTLDQMLSDVLGRTRMLNQEMSELIDEQVVEVCHAAILETYNIIRPLVRDSYQTDVLVSETDNLINISTIGIDLTARVPVLYDTVQGRIKIYPTDVFFNMKDAEAVNPEALFARITNAETGGNSVLLIETVRGSSRQAVGRLTLTYGRIPVKTLKADTDRHLDLPDRYVPFATYTAISRLFSIAGKQAPDDIVQPLKTAATAIASEYALLTKEAA